MGAHVNVDEFFLLLRPVTVAARAVPDAQQVDTNPRRRNAQIQTWPGNPADPMQHEDETQNPALGR